MTEKELASTSYHNECMPYGDTKQTVLKLFESVLLLFHSPYYRCSRDTKYKYTSG